MTQPNRYIVEYTSREGWDWVNILAPSKEAAAERVGAGRPWIRPSMKVHTIEEFDALFKKGVTT